jgi:HAD superfamily hydrolase (TIGR01509 family)
MGLLAMNAMTAAGLVIFDCDGVLIDSETIAARVHAEALEALGYAYTTDDMRRFVGVSGRDMCRIIEEESGRPLPEDYGVSTRETLWLAYHQELAAVPHVAEAIDALDEAVCVASSSSPESLRLSLGLVGLYERFAPHVFSATQVARGKPAPDLFLFAARQMGVPPSRCLVVEDSVAGVTGARAAGMTVLGFTGASHCGPGHGTALAQAGATAVFDDMRRLPGLVGQHRRG